MASSVLYDDQIIRDARKNHIGWSGMPGIPLSTHRGQAAEKVATKGGGSGRNVGRSTNSASGILRFPSNLGITTEQQNYMMFTFKEISSASAAGGGTRGADPRNLVFKTATGWPVILLPIPAGINEAYTQNWTESQVAGRHAMIAEKGAGAIEAVGQMIADRSPGGITGGISGMISRIGQNKDKASQAAGAMADVGEGFLGKANKTMGNTLTELGAMAITSNLVEAGDIARAGQYSAGLRLIDQAMLNYGGPGFRSFQFNYSLKPNNQRESDMAYYMTQAFKEFSAPNQRATKYTRVYDLPGVFKIQFYYGGGEHKIGRIGHCALTNINIRYGGDKFTTFSGSHMPVQWDISLSFKELELLNRDAIKAESTNSQSASWPNYVPHHTTTAEDSAQYDYGHFRDDVSLED